MLPYSKPTLSSAACVLLRMRKPNGLRHDGRNAQAPRTARTAPTHRQALVRPVRGRGPAVRAAAGRRAVRAARVVARGGTGLRADNAPGRQDGGAAGARGGTKKPWRFRRQGSEG